MTDDEGSEAAAADTEAGDDADDLPPEGEQLVERVAEHDDDLAAEVREVVEAAVERGDRAAKLETELEEAREEAEDFKDRLKRKQADFQNYKKRQDREKERIRERATEDLVERLLGVRDNLKRAVDEDHDDVESIREGVKMTLREFDRVLDAENVTEIEPEPGEEVDPQRHEVMMRVDADQPEGTVADVYSPGYEMADKVLETAQVTVSTGAADDDEDDETDETEAEEADSDEVAEAVDDALDDEDAEGDDAEDAADDGEDVAEADDDAVAEAVDDDPIEAEAPPEDDEEDED